MKKLIITIMLAIFLASLLLVSMTSALTISHIQTSPSEIKPGEDADIEITLENDEDTDIQDVSVKLDLTNLPFVPSDSSNEETIDEIDEDDSEVFGFRILALSDAASGVYKIPIEISYKLNTEIKQRSGMLSLTINAVPELDVQIEDSTLLKGQQNELILKIINKGLSDVQFLEIEVRDGAGFSVLSPKKTYIGEVASDDFDTAELKIYINENAAGLVSFPVTIKYKDITNKEYEKSYSLQLKTYTKKQAIQLGLIKQSKIGFYVFLIIVVVILYIVYRKLKKARRARKARQEEKNRKV